MADRDVQTCQFELVLQLLLLLLMLTIDDDDDIVMSCLVL